MAIGRRPEVKVHVGDGECEDADSNLNSGELLRMLLGIVSLLFLEFFDA